MIKISKKRTLKSAIEKINKHLKQRYLKREYINTFYLIGLFGKMFNWLGRIERLSEYEIGYIRRFYLGNTIILKLEREIIFTSNLRRNKEVLSYHKITIEKGENFLDKTIEEINKIILLEKQKEITEKEKQDEQKINKIRKFFKDNKISYLDFMEIHNSLMHELPSNKREKLLEELRC